MALFGNIFGAKDLAREYADHVDRIRQKELFAGQSSLAEPSLNEAYGNIYGSSVQQVGLQNSLGNAYRVPTPPPPLDPNTIEAFAIPMSRLVMMWQARYGDTWVNAAVPLDDSFYSKACQRLHNASMFERFEGWVRLKESVDADR